MSYRNRAVARLWSVAMDHDAAYKYIYSLDPVVAQLLRFVVPDWAELLDLAAPDTSRPITGPHRSAGIRVCASTN